MGAEFLFPNCDSNFGKNLHGLIADIRVESEASKAEKARLEEENRLLRAKLEGTPSKGVMLTPIPEEKREPVA